MGNRCRDSLSNSSLRNPQSSGRFRCSAVSAQLPSESTARNSSESRSVILTSFRSVTKSGASSHVMLWFLLITLSTCTLVCALERSFIVKAHEDIPCSLESLRAHETEHRTHFAPADLVQW